MNTIKMLAYLVLALIGITIFLLGSIFYPVIAVLIVIWIAFKAIYTQSIEQSHIRKA